MPLSERAHLLALLLPVLWLGLLLSISFMEAPLKFRASGVTREAALSIGRLVFRTLARVELTLWSLEAVALWFAGWPAPGTVWLVALALILAVQQVWLLPALDGRATAVLSGESIPPGRRLHRLYVGGECAKVLVLPALCWSLARAVTVAGV